MAAARNSSSSSRAWRSVRSAISTFHGPLGWCESLAHGADGLVEGDVGQRVGLEQVEHERGGADLQRVGEGEQIRVAQKQVEAAEPAVIGQRLVAGVDERAVELDPLVNIGLDEIGALGNLVRHELARRPSCRSAAAPGSCRRGPRRRAGCARRGKSAACRCCAWSAAHRD